jgi:DNA-binding NarL/FixJ family response regulator
MRDVFSDLSPIPTGFFRQDGVMSNDSAAFEDSSSTGEGVELAILEPRPLLAQLLTACVRREGRFETIEQFQGPLCLDPFDKFTPPRVVVLSAHGETIYFQSLLRDCREACPNSSLVVLDSRANPATALCAARQGVLAYWTWLDPLDEVLSAVHWAAMGRPSRSPHARQWLTCGPQRLVGLPRSERSALTLLSRVELRLFQLLARGDATEKYAETLGVSSESLDDHLDSLMHKLNVEEKAELIRRACRAGLL